MATKVFISYSSADRAEALSVRKLLTNRGCTVWLDVFDIRVGAELKRELGEGIGNADVLCLLLSPTAVASPWVAEEIARSSEQSSQHGMRFVAVLLRPCRPPNELLGRVMLDATAGIASPDVSARLTRAVLGADAIGDVEIDAALQEALQARQNEMEAALVLPELAAQLDAVRELPVRKLRISFRPQALPPGKVLAISFTFDQLLSQPMWFLFAHYREGRTWPEWMNTMKELEHNQIRSDGKRIDGRFEWFDHVRVLNAGIDGTDLRDLPATFTLELSGERWRPGGAIASYSGGPTVPHLEQTMQVPSLATMIDKGASFAVALLGREQGSQEPVVPEENDFDVRIVGASTDPEITLFRSAHGPVGRAVLRGAFLQNRKSFIEREAILGLYPRMHELAAQERQRRREAAFALLERPEQELSPEERGTVGLLHYGRARLEMFRVLGSAPRPGPARDRLHISAIHECRAVCRILGPLATEDPRFDEVGMVFWAASTLAHYYLKGGAADRALSYAEVALDFVRQAAGRPPDEPGYERWRAQAMARLAEAQGAIGRHAAALASLDGAIEVCRALHHALPTAARRVDLLGAIESALSVSASWAAAGAVERQRWEALAESLARLN